MFVRVKTSGKYQYLQIVENRREGRKTLQRVVATIGRLDEIKKRGEIENLIRSLSRFSEKTLLILSGKGEVNALAKKIGPALIFDRLWREVGIQKILTSVLSSRKFEFDVERVIFMTVLHRLFASGSDRSCDKWRRDYIIEGLNDISLHHIYRAMAYLGEEIEDQKDRTPFSPRCTKDLIEEELFHLHRDLFSGLDMVFFDTTSLYFEGEGGKTLGELGNNKDHRPDLKQMVVGVIIDSNGYPICCEMWPGMVADVKTLVPTINRLKNRFNINQVCIVSDRGMISNETIAYLEQKNIPYILGARMRRVKEIREDVLSRAGRYHEVHSKSLKVKEVVVNDRRYIVCINEKQARKDMEERQLIINSLKEKIYSNPKSLVGNKGFRKYLKLDRNTITINQDKIDEESRYDGKWVIRTNTSMKAEDVALKYKELWRVEQVFKDMKSALDTRPIYHRLDETIRGHVFCSFLALIIRKELDRRFEQHGYDLEWADIKQDLDALQEIIIEDNGKKLAIRSQCLGVCGKIFKATGVAIPKTIRELI